MFEQLRIRSLSKKKKSSHTSESPNSVSSNSVEVSPRPLYGVYLAAVNTSSSQSQACWMCPGRNRLGDGLGRSKLIVESVSHSQVTEWRLWALDYTCCLRALPLPQFQIAKSLRSRTTKFDADHLIRVSDLDFAATRRYPPESISIGGICIQPINLIERSSALTSEFPRIFISISLAVCHEWRWFSGM